MKILQVPECPCNVMAFALAVTSAMDVSWAVAACSSTQVPSSWLPFHSFFNEQKLHYSHEKVFSQYLLILAALSSLHRERHLQLHPFPFSHLVQTDQFSQSFSICTILYPALVSPKGLPLPLGVFRTNAE